MAPSASQRIPVSIHALVRVRPQLHNDPRRKRRFNPRTRESATILVSLLWDVTRSFNPRTRESATESFRPHIPTPYVSIHALVRVRQVSCKASPREQGFNPRTRESATSQKWVLKNPHSVSIHALVRVRPGHTHLQRGDRGFNPRTRESATAWTPMA